MGIREYFEDRTTADKVKMGVVVVLLLVGIVLIWNQLFTSDAPPGTPVAAPTAPEADPTQPNAKAPPVVPVNRGGIIGK